MPRYHNILVCSVSAALCACAPADQVSVQEQNKDFVRQFLEEFDAAPSHEVVDLEE